MKMRTSSIIKSCILFMLIVSMFPVPDVNANTDFPPPNDQSPIVIRQGGPTIRIVPVYPSTPRLSDSMTTTVYRSGWTDATWVYYPYPLKYEHNGSHNSESDLVEEQIWVDGSLNVGDSGVVHSCSNHSAGQYAQCGTSKTYSWKYKFTATSWHFYHKSGYVDQNFKTAKTLTP